MSERFRRLIRNTGPMSLAHFMAESNAAYYASKDPLGRSGDFITAPEISQMFGELIGLWLADMWIRSGRPSLTHYVELGPGRGTLAQDVLRAARAHGLEPDVHFVETSPELSRMQAQAVPNASWHSDLSTVSECGPMLVVANEFLDALPIRQIVRTAMGWRERMVGLSQDGFVFVAGQQPMDAAVPTAFREYPEGTILETSPAAAAVMAEVAQRLAAQGGCGLLIDYGHAKPRTGSTLQAVRAHHKVDVLAAPGAADLSAHVDFATLAQIAQAGGARHLGTVDQGAWLCAMGIETRAQMLLKQEPQQRDSIMAAQRRLIADEEMGTLFKVMGLAAPDWPDGEGFRA